VLTGFGNILVSLVVVIAGHCSLGLVSSCGIYCVLGRCCSWSLLFRLGLFMWHLWRS